MSHLTDSALATVAWTAGFRGDGLITAVAVALAESGGDPSAVNTTGNTPPSRDRGLWQINDYWHPEVTDDQAFSPSGCATAAFRISNGGQDWTPWATFKSGAYGQFVGRARTASDAINALPFVLKRFLYLADPMLTGDDVTLCQKVVRVSPDSLYGPITHDAVVTWQSKRGLAADGIVGPITAKSFGWSWSK